MRAIITRLIIVSFAIFLALPSYGGEVAKLYSDLGLSNITSDTLLMRPKISRSKYIIVEYGSRPGHIGLSLFSPEVKKLTNIKVCNFVERLFLYLSMIDSSTAQSYLSRNKITLTHNGINYGGPKFVNIGSLIDKMDQPSTFNIENNGDRYIVNIEYEANDAIQLSFPTDWQLIVGLDKKESDEAMHESLKEETLYKKEYIAPKPESLREYGDLLVKEGGSFMIDKVNNHIYYDPSTLRPIVSSSHEAESINNLMLGEVANDLNIKITHRMYGNATPKFVISLFDFFNHFRDGYDIYTACEPKDNGESQYITLLHNVDFNTIHLLIITAKPEDIISGEKILNADFFSNIPQNYIKSLF